MDDQPDTEGGLARLHAGHETHILQEVMRASQAATSVFSRVVGMPSSELAVLRQLGIRHPRPQGVLALARQLGVDPAAVTRLLQSLEKRGLAQREADERDARRRSASLTPAGLRAVVELHDRGHALESAVMEGISAEDAAAAARVLGRLRAAIEALR